MMEERLIALEAKVREIETRLAGHVPPLPVPEPPPVAQEVAQDAAPKDEC